MICTIFFIFFSCLVFHKILIVFQIQALTCWQIFEIVKNTLHLTLDNQLNDLEEGLATFNGGPVTISQINKISLKKMLCTMKKKWDKASRKADFFFKSNKEWLESSAIIRVS